MNILIIYSSLVKIALTSIFLLVIPFLYIGYRWISASQIVINKSIVINFLLLFIPTIIYLAAPLYMWITFSLQATTLENEIVRSAVTDIKADSNINKMLLEMNISLIDVTISGRGIYLVVDKKEFQRDTINNRITEIIEQKLPDISDGLTNKDTDIRINAIYYYLSTNNDKNRIAKDELNIVLSKSSSVD